MADVCGCYFWTMRFLSVVTCLGVLAAHAQVQLQWQHRFDAPNELTGFGDVGLGLDRRGDSLMVGHSWENFAQTTLFAADDGQVLWTMGTADTVYHLGGRSFFGNTIVSGERTASGNGISARSSLIGLDGVLHWTVDAGLMNVQRLRGPLVNAAEDTAHVLAYGSGVLHDLRVDHIGSAGGWSYTPAHPWPGFETCLAADGSVIITAMVDLPGAFSDVPRLMRFDAAGAPTWSTWLADTTGFVVSAPARTVHWNADTLLSVHTTWQGLVQLRMTDADDGSVLWSFTDSLGLVLELASLAVVPEAQRIHVGLHGGTSIAYAPGAGRLWTDSVNAQANYMEVAVLANSAHAVSIVTDDRHIGQGQDLHIRLLDPATGALVDTAWVNDTIGTHDLFENALLWGDELHLLTAATFDTVSILNESTTLLLSTFNLATPTALPGPKPSASPRTAVVTRGSIAALLAPLLAPWTALDAAGRVHAVGSPADLDAWYGTAPPGTYQVLGAGGRSRLMFIRP